MVPALVSIPLRLSWLSHPGYLLIVGFHSGKNSGYVLGMASGALRTSLIETGQPMMILDGDMGVNFPDGSLR